MNLFKLYSTRNFICSFQFQFLENRISTQLYCLIWAYSILRGLFDQSSVFYNVLRTIKSRQKIQLHHINIRNSWKNYINIYFSFIYWEFVLLLIKIVCWFHIYKETYPYSIFVFEWDLCIILIFSYKKFINVGGRLWKKILLCAFVSLLCD